MREYTEWKCWRCGHEVWSPERPQPISWDDGHTCRFVNDSEPVFKYDCKPDDWRQLIKAMRSGNRFEVDKKLFYYFMEVIPPTFLNQIVKLPQGEVLATFGFAEGAEPITVFWRDRGRYFGQQTEMINSL